MREERDQGGHQAFGLNDCNDGVIFKFRKYSGRSELSGGGESSVLLSVYKMSPPKWRC